MGGAIVSMYTIKYPEDVGMICLLAPPRKYGQVYREIRRLLGL